MKTARQLFTVFMIALLLVSVVSAAPFKILSSSNVVKTIVSQPVEQVQNIVEPAQESVVENEPVVQTSATAKAYTTLASRQSFVIIKEQEPEVVIADRVFDDVHIYYPHDDNDNTPANQPEEGAQEEQGADAPSDDIDDSMQIDSNFGVHREALTLQDRVWFDWIGPESTLLHFEEKSVSGDTTVGETFTITVTASDSDDEVTRVSLGVSPYTNDDYDIRDCESGVHSCTQEFELSESEPGIYTYRIKAKNERNQIISDAVIVTVVEAATTSSFNFHTAALDGADWDAGVTDYIDSMIFIWGDVVTGLDLAGTPFATFTVPSGYLLAALYESSGYSDDTDHFYFDPNLPSCSGDSCLLSAEVNGTTWTTSCDLISWDDHYACELSNGEGYRITFDYRATGDPIGDNTIRRYNILYPESAPIVNFGSEDFTFDEGGSVVIDLDDYVTDSDTEDSEIEWLVLREVNLAVDIDPSTHEATITQVNPAWIGSELIEFVAFDPEGNRGSDVTTVSVLDMSNNPPVITDTNPEEGDVNVGMAGSRMFRIDAIDPDYDYLTVTWRKEGTVVASDTFSYMYSDTDGLSHTLTATVSDGTESAEASWTIDIVEPIGDLAGTITDSDTGLPLEGVLVELLDAGMGAVDSMTTPGSGGYIFEGLFAGTYNLRLTLEGYEDVIVNDVQILAGEITIQDVQMDEIPPPIGTLRGIVTDTADGSALSGVIVEAFAPGMVLEDSTTTNAFGQYSMDLNEGMYTVRFSHAGYDTEEFAGVVIVTGGTTIQDADMSETVDPRGTIQGTITDVDSGTPLSGALVRILDGGTLVNSTTTGASGTYSMEIMGDVYDIEVTRSGYKPETLSGVSVPAGSITTRNFELSVWWDSAWQYRKAIDLDSGSALTDYSLLLNITHVTGMNADFSDLRFLSEDHSVELDYWVAEQIDGAWCSVWIEFDDVGAGSDTQAIMYYGNPLATSNSDGPSTFLIWDDFEDGSLDPAIWTDVSVGGASVTESSGYATFSYDGSHRGYLRTLEDMPLNFEIMFDAKLDSAGAQFYMFSQWDGTHTGPFDTVSGSYVELVDAYADSQSLTAVLSDVRTPIGPSVNTARPFDFNFHKMNRYEGDYEYWLGSDLIISGYNDIALPSRYIGFTGRETASASRIDNVIVRNYVSPEPVYSVGVAESRTL